MARPVRFAGCENYATRARQLRRRNDSDLFDLDTNIKVVYDAESHWIHTRQLRRRNDLDLIGSDTNTKVVYLETSK